MRGFSRLGSAATRPHGRGDAELRGSLLALRSIARRVLQLTEEERELSMLYSNHSCDANLGMRGEITFVAMRAIPAGEELTHDWATTDDDDYSVECKCGAPNCRKMLTGNDWQRPELQKRYAEYFSAYLTRKIAAGLSSRAKRGSSLSD